MTPRGQSLLELALCLPVVLALALGAAALVRLADAKSGLDGATAAAVADAARQTSASAASVCAQNRFLGIAAAYGLESPSLSLTGDFSRASMYTATGSARVDLSFVPLWFLPGTVPIISQAQAWVEPWRSRAGQACAG